MKIQKLEGVRTSLNSSTNNNIEHFITLQKTIKELEKMLIRKYAESNDTKYSTDCTKSCWKDLHVVIVD